MRPSGSTPEGIAAADRAVGTVANSTHPPPRDSGSTPPSSPPTPPPRPGTAPPTPRARVGAGPAPEQPADRAARAGHGAPDAERAVALGPLGEGGGEDGEGGRREDRGAEPLEGARGDQLAVVLRQAAEQRRDGEEDEAGGEDPAAAEQGGHAAAEQQEAAEYEGVRVDDPGQVLLGEVEIAADGRQRDVDDRGVEHDDELRRREQDEREALPRYWL